MTTTIEPGLLRAARAALGWGLVEAGQHAGLSVATVLVAEGRAARSAFASAVAVDSLRRAYGEAGVEFFHDGAAKRGIQISFAQPRSGNRIPLKLQ